MDSEKLKQRIGSNIAACRRRSNLTQAELAEKLNYSDKAVSKWERGESIPDVITLVQLAEQFGVSVNDLLLGIQSEKVPPKAHKQTGSRVNRKVLQMLHLPLSFPAELSALSWELPYPLQHAPS